MINTVDPVWFFKKEDDIMDLVNIKAFELLLHLRLCRGKLDYLDMEKLKNKHDKPTKSPSIPPNTSIVLKRNKSIEQVEITFDSIKRRNLELVHLQQTGEFNMASCKWLQLIKCGQILSHTL